MPDFILEIGTEEAPARFLKNEEKELLSRFLTALAEAGIEHGEAISMATPRRLALIVRNVADKQKSTEEIITGPPLAVSYTAEGKPSPALLGFLKGHDLKEEDVFTQKSSRGEYIAARKVSGGRASLELLEEICPTVLASLPFPKRMRWGTNSVAYARPIRWILALLGDEQLVFEFASIKADRLTYGHRVHGLGPHRVKNADDWLKISEEKSHVLPDPAKRREIIKASGNKAAQEIGGEIVWKENLLDEVCGLVEQPVPILGAFEPVYLELPEEVLLTSMESHQKSFGVRGADGKLLPHFLTVLNLHPQDLELVKKGWERVLRARLEDARFFWRSDLNSKLEDWLAKLENVIFIGALGSMGEKSRRLEKLCKWLAEDVAPSKVSLAGRAGRVAKADLVSAMVGEFDSLQGIMGGIYAEKAGEDPSVAEAIKEQYLPAGPDSPLPKSDLGAILSIASKADTLAGCFGLNMIPSGAADPNGLRRGALGIIRILIDKNWDLKSSSLFDVARELYGDKDWKLSTEESRQRLLDFMTARLRAYYIALGYETLMVDAVLDNGVEHIAESKRKLDALSAFAASPQFLDSARILKRVENISRNAAADKEPWQEALLQEDAEKKLAKKLAELLPAWDEALRKGEYNKLFSELTAINEEVNNFFENVMVNCEDAKLRQNRLRLLRSLGRPYRAIANFALLQI